ncbi:hypothetical protein TWF718_005311 [Orbilia javanica]|uniref:Uncharacterized protein n=1 Tax=Orbilia javanica TaxID=47235 RepID=A0AAN8RIQ9_9PEZI
MAAEGDTQDVINVSADVDSLSIDDKIQMLSMKFQVLESENKELKEDIKVLRSENGTLNDRVKELEDERQCWTSENSRIMFDNEWLGDRYRDAEEDVERVKDALGHQGREYFRLGRAVSELEYEARERERQVTDLEREVVISRATGKLTDASIFRLDARVARFEERIRAIENGLSLLQCRNAQTRGWHDRLEDLDIIGRLGHLELSVRRLEEGPSEEQQESVSDQTTQPEPAKPLDAWSATADDPW